MTTLIINDDIAAALTARAQEKGLSLEGFLESLATESKGAAALAGNSRSQESDSDSLDGLLTCLDAEAEDGPYPTSTFTRAEIYRDHP